MLFPAPLRPMAPSTSPHSTSKPHPPYPVSASGLRSSLGSVAEPPFVVSPELALVDPELARAARLLLPEAGAVWWRTGGTRASVSPSAAPLSTLREEVPIAAEPTPAVRAGTGAVRAIILGSAAVLFAAVGVVLAAELLRKPSSFFTRETLVRPPATGVAPPGRVSPPRRSSRARPSATPKTHPKSRRVPRARSERSQVLPPLVWVHVPDATHYRVELYRRGRRIFRARTAEPRLQMPRSWRYGGKRFRLSPGRYRWVVYPSRGEGRYSAPVVNARLVVPRAGQGQ